MGDRFWSRIVWKTVKVDGVKSVAFCTKNVGAEIVANHKGCRFHGSRLLKSVVEELGCRFVGTCIFAEDDGVEIVEEPTRTEFLVLHFMETTAAHVHTVIFCPKIIHQFLGTLNKPGFDGTE